ncbi:hypothetical protein V8E36_008500 [Tilletia maclaganii]
MTTRPPRHWITSHEHPCNSEVRLSPGDSSVHASPVAAAVGGSTRGSSVPVSPRAGGLGDDDANEGKVVMKNKILAVGRMGRVFVLLCEEAERVSELKLASATGKLPDATLALGSEGIKKAITSFDEARKVDIENERLPLDLIDADEAQPASSAGEGRIASPIPEADEHSSSPSRSSLPGSACTFCSGSRTRAASPGGAHNRLPPVRSSAGFSSQLGHGPGQGSADRDKIGKTSEKSCSNGDNDDELEEDESDRVEAA